MFHKLNGGAASMREEVVELARELIRIPSISGMEKDEADLVLRKMKELGYDEVFRDRIGNVVGIVKGTGGGPNIMFNSHLDHVDPGDPSNWEYDPYGGEVADGCIHGRAASDVKSGLASQLMAGALLQRMGLRLRGDLIVSGTVQEEPAEMFGMKFLLDRTFAERGIAFDLMVSSEATSMNVYLGHRGRLELELRTKGRTSHASAPHRGINAVYKMLPVIEAARRMEAALPVHPVLGQATLALTIISCLPGALSIVPDTCTVSIDRRFVPGEAIEDMMSAFVDLFARLKAEDPDFRAEISVRKVNEISYTGYAGEAEKFMPAWLLEENHPAVVRAVQGLRKIGQNPAFGKWDFVTDASYVTGIMGIPSVGYSPMEEKYAHTPYDRCRLDYLVQSIAGNAAIALNFSG